MSIFYSPSNVNPTHPLPFIVRIAEKSNNWRLWLGCDKCHEHLQLHVLEQCHTYVLNCRYFDWERSCSCLLSSIAAAPREVGHKSKLAASNKCWSKMRWWTGLLLWGIRQSPQYCTSSLEQYSLGLWAKSQLLYNGTVSSYGPSIIVENSNLKL